LKLQLAVDARDVLRDRRGIGRYVRELLRRFAAVDDVALTLLVDAPLPQLVRSRFRELLGRDSFALARRVPANCDVIWHPWNGTFFAASAPAVATIHDVVPFAYPDPEPRKMHAQQAPFLRSAENSVAIATDSTFSAREIENRLGVPAERIRTIPLGVGPPFRPGSPTDVRPPYILFVGSDEPHKNARPLLEGAHHALEGRTTRLLTLGLKHSGSASETELVDLYRGATFLAAPGLYEGFGLPLLEAMACGTPVLAARSGPYPEVCANAAAYVEEPRDPRAWSAAINSLLDDGARRSELRERGLQRAAELTWERTADATLDLLRAHARPDAKPANANAARS
jgi:glycosyltransferase involved in cell wall biosynthesis